MPPVNPGNTLVPNNISIPYAFVDDSLTEVLGDGRGITAERILECNWDDRFTLAYEILGIVNQYSGAQIYYRAQKYPESSTSIARRISISGFPKLISFVNDMPVYEKARLAISYSTPEFSSGGTESGEVLVSEYLEPTAEFLNLPRKELYWDAAKTQPVSNVDTPGFLVKMVDWVYTRHFVENIPTASLTLMGNVNDAPIVSSRLGLTFGAETLLFSPPALSHEITAAGPQSWQVTYRFSYRPQGWNKFPRQSGTAYVFGPIYNEDGNIIKPYTPADFSSVIVTS